MSIDVTLVPQEAVDRLRRLLNADLADAPDALLADYVAASGWETDTAINLDLHAAAADYLEDGLPDLAAQYDFNADGGNFARSQAYQQRMATIRYHRSHRSPRSLEVTNG